MSERDGGADSGAAERAFVALRAEVAALRTAAEQQASMPDYTLTLGTIVKELQTVDERLTAIEAHPALAMTPNVYSAELSAATEGARRARDNELWDAKVALSNSMRELQQLSRNAQTRQEQQRWLELAVAFGVVLGIALWYLLPSFLPWSVGDWLASSLIGGGRWQAGQTLMQRANPDSFGRMVRLYNACGERQVEMCETAITARSATTPGSTPSAGTPSRFGAPR